MKSIKNQLLMRTIDKVDLVMKVQVKEKSDF